MSERSMGGTYGGGPRMSGGDIWAVIIMIAIVLLAFWHHGSFGPPPWR